MRVLRRCRFLAACLVAALLVANVSATAGVVARWTFDHTAGADGIADESGTFRAQVMNASGAAGLQALDDRGVFLVPGTAAGDCLTLGDGAAFDLTKAFTLEAWFRPDAAPAGSYAMILGKRYNQQFQLTWTPNGGNTIEFYVGGGDLLRQRCWAEHLPVGRWLHVVAAYAGTATEGPNQWLYVNGDLARCVRNDVRLASDCGPLRLGQNAVMGLSGGVPMAWDEVAVYDHAFSAADAVAAYQAKAPPVGAAATDHWELSGGLEGWSEVDARSTGGAVRDGMSGVVQRGGVAAAGEAALAGGAGDWRFALRGVPPQSVSGAWRRTLETPLAGAAIRYLQVRYRAHGLQRAATPLPALTLECDRGNVPVLTSSHLILDGRTHDLVAEVTLPGTAENVRVDLRCQGSTAELVLEALALLPALPQPAPEAAGALPPGVAAMPLPPGPRCRLKTVFDTALAGHGKAVPHAVGTLGAGRVLVDGLAFQSPADDAVLWAADTATPQNEVEVEALGTRVKRSSFLPAGRDDVIAVEIGQPVAEVYLLLVSDLPALEKQYCQPPIPCVVRDVEAFSVDLVYADGGLDTVFPWSPRDEGYRVVGLAGGYVLAADPGRALQRIVLHNRMYGRTIGVAAVTINGAAPRFPQLNAEPPPPAVAPSDSGEAGHGVTFVGGIARISHGPGTLILDCRDGFAIRELRNDAAPAASIWPAPDSGIDVGLAGRWFSGSDFRVTAAEALAADTFAVRLAGRKPDLPLELELTFRAESGAGVVASLGATNTGPAELRATFRFPSFKRFRVGTLADTWLFFPQYRNVLTDQEAFCKQPNHRGFLLQFMDVFSPTAGGGLCLLTRNPGQEPVQYALAKGPDGVSAYIENEGEDFVLAPGASRRFCDRVVALHTGDWHAGADTYRRWVGTWYKPAHSQDKPWFRQAAWVRSHITSAAIARQISHTPPLYDAAGQRWRLAEFLAADRALLGTDPDIVHFYVWAFDESRNGDQARNGDYGGKDYANLGGIASFRQAIAQLRGPLGKPVSLYTIWDRYTPGTEFEQRFGDRLARVTASGQKLASADLVSISPGIPEWQAYAWQTLRRLQQDTSADILYLDVFGTDDRARDFNREGGHAHVPNWVAEGDREFLAGLRQALPAQTALWGEFPVPDVASQYWDGFLSYDCIPLHSYLAETLDERETACAWSAHTFPPNVLRAVLPHLRQVVFPVGTEGSTSNWRYLKFLLFNGQALFDTTWRLYDETCRERLGRAIGLQRTYADCFDSDTPEILVPTLRAQVFANRFPGRGRTVWTLFNGRYRPVRGEVLRLPHAPGARYHDAWNDRELTPAWRDGDAVLAIELPPQGIGCVVQSGP